MGSLLSALMKNLLQNRCQYLAIVSLTWFLIGCENQRATQCQDLIEIANGVTSQAKKVAASSQETTVEMKTWLQAADIMTLAANEIEALPLKDPQLIAYQGNLAGVFRIYSQATYDAIKARENKNLSALEIARDNAKKAGQLNQALVTKINSYCTIQ